MCQWMVYPSFYDPDTLFICWRILEHDFLFRGEICMCENLRGIICTAESDSPVPDKFYVMTSGGKG